MARSARIYPPHPATVVRGGCITRSGAVLMFVENGQLKEIFPNGLELHDDQVNRHLRVWYTHNFGKTLVLEHRGINTLQLYLHGVTPAELAADMVILERLVFPLNGGQATKGQLQGLISRVRACEGIL